MEADRTDGLAVCPGSAVFFERPGWGESKISELFSTTPELPGLCKTCDILLKELEPSPNAQGSATGQEGRL